MSVITITANTIIIYFHYFYGKHYLYKIVFVSSLLKSLLLHFLCNSLVNVVIMDPFFTLVFVFQFSCYCIHSAFPINIFNKYYCKLSVSSFFIMLLFKLLLVISIIIVSTTTTNNNNIITITIMKVMNIILAIITIIDNNYFCKGLQLLSFKLIKCENLKNEITSIFHL